MLNHKYLDNIRSLERFLMYNPEDLDPSYKSKEIENKTELSEDEIWYSYHIDKETGKIVYT